MSMDKIRFSSFLCSEFMPGSSSEDYLDADITSSLTDHKSQHSASETSKNSTEGKVIQTADPSSRSRSRKDRRRRVLNFLRVPFALEYFLSFGIQLCLETFLHTFTVLPIRAMLALPVFLFRRPSKSHSTESPQSSSPYAKMHFLKRVLKSGFESLRRASPAFRAACTVDLLRALLIACGTGALLMVDMSALYHMIRVQAVVKIYILFNILEIADRLLTSFGQDIMDAFTLTVQESCESWSSPAPVDPAPAANPSAENPPPEASACPTPASSPRVSIPDVSQLRRRLVDQSTPVDCASTVRADRTLTAENIEPDLSDGGDRAVPEARAVPNARSQTDAQTLPQGTPPSTPVPSKTSESTAPAAPKQTRATVLDSSLLDILPHFALAAIYVIVHSMIFLVQAITLNVAFNSYNKALLTILISNNFMEIKGAVAKRFNRQNLFQVACFDLRERFHYVVLLSFVCLRNLSEVDWDFDYLWKDLLPDVLLVLGSECGVDWIKHAFITKFNELSSQLYWEFRMSLAFDLIGFKQNLLQSSRPTEFSQTASTPGHDAYGDTKRSIHRRRTSHTPGFFDLRAEGTLSGAHGKNGDGSSGRRKHNSQSQEDSQKDKEKEKEKKKEDQQQTPEDEPDALADLLARRLGQPFIPHACLVLRLATQTLGVGRLLVYTYRSCLTSPYLMPSSEALHQWLFVVALLLLFFAALFTTKLLNGIIMLGRACKNLHPQEIGEFFGTSPHRKHAISTSDCTSEPIKPPHAPPEPVFCPPPAASSGLGVSASYSETTIRKRSCVSRLGRIDSESIDSDGVFPFTTGEAPLSAPASTDKKNFPLKSGPTTASRFSATRSFSVERDAEQRSASVASSSMGHTSRSSSHLPRDRERRTASLLSEPKHRLSTRDLSSERCSPCQHCGGSREEAAAGEAPRGRLGQFDTGSHAGSTSSLYMCGLEDECSLHAVPSRYDANESSNEAETQRPSDHSQFA